MLIFPSCSEESLGSQTSHGLITDLHVDRSPGYLEDDQGRRGKEKSDDLKHITGYLRNSP